MSTSFQTCPAPWSQVRYVLTGSMGEPKVYDGLRDEYVGWSDWHDKSQPSVGKRLTIPVKKGFLRWVNFWKRNNNSYRVGKWMVSLWTFCFVPHHSDETEFLCDILIFNAM